MPWYCGYCSRWNPSGHRVCPTCRRPPHGRLCLSCKKPVPTEAVCCPACAGTRLTEPGTGPVAPAVFVRLGLAASLIVGGALFSFFVLWPRAVWLRDWGVALFWTGAVYAGAFWVVTGLLPAPLGKELRRAGTGLVRRALRLVTGLLK